MKNTSNSKSSSSVRNAIITGVLLLAAIGAVFAYLNRDKLFADEKKPAIETEVTMTETSKETKESPAEDTEATFADETVDEWDPEFEADIAEFERRSADAVIKPSDITDPDIKELATYYSGYELIDLSKQLSLMEDYNEGYYFSFIDCLKPQIKDVSGFYCHSNSASVYWNLLIFKMNEEDLPDYMDSIVQNDIHAVNTQDDGSLFVKSVDSDGNTVYTWSSHSDGGTSKTDYEITYDQNTKIVKVYAEESGGVG